jgi:hypothetical protein
LTYRDRARRASGCDCWAFDALPSDLTTEETSMLQRHMPEPVKVGLTTYPQHCWASYPALRRRLNASQSQWKVCERYFITTRGLRAQLPLPAMTWTRLTLVPWDQIVFGRIYPRRNTRPSLLLTPRIGCDIADEVRTKMPVRGADPRLIRRFWDQIVFGRIYPRRNTRPSLGCGGIESYLVSPEP